MIAFGIFALMWCGMSLVFLFRAGAFAWKERRYGHVCVATSGQVVGEERRTRTVSASSGGRRELSFYYPVVEFRTNEGNDVRASPQINVAHRYAVGTTVAVSYLPENPTHIRVVGDSVARYGPGLAVAAGVIFFLAGVGMVLGALMAAS